MLLVKLASVTACLALLSACSGSAVTIADQLSQPPLFDAGGDDAAPPVVVPDAGSPAVDAPAPTADAGSSEDAATVRESGQDAGSDLGTVEATAEAGSDAQTPVDAGPDATADVNAPDADLGAGLTCIVTGAAGGTYYGCRASSQFAVSATCPNWGGQSVGCQPGVDTPTPDVPCQSHTACEVYAPPNGTLIGTTP